MYDWVRSTGQQEMFRAWSLLSGDISWSLGREKKIGDSSRI